MPSIFPKTLDWHSAIGNFILNYGTVEYLVFVFLKDHLEPAEFERLTNWHLKDRLNRIAKYLGDTNSLREQRITFQRLVERLDGIRDLRNHIAHGHLHLQWNPENGKPIITIFRAKDLDKENGAESKHLEFHELRAALTTLRDLICDLERFVGFSPAETHQSPAA